MKTHDLTNGFFFTLNDDGSATITNPERNIRNELPAESVMRLKEIFQRLHPIRGSKHGTYHAIGGRVA